MKKVLIITYYWPPAGGPGVQRVLRFVKYLPRFGWEPIILTVKDGEYPALDNQLVDEIPKWVKVYKTTSIEPFLLYKKITGKKTDHRIPTFVLNKNEGDSFSEKMSRWIRLNLFIPDARIGWIPFALKKARKIIKEHKIDVIFSSSPPHTVQLIAAKIRKDTGIPWIADLRDPWLEIVYYQNVNRSKFSKWVDGLLEKKALSGADVLLTISNDIQQLLNKKVGKEKSYIISNGFDNEAFISTEAETNSNKLNIVYTGVISEARVPKTFLQVLGEMAKQNDLMDVNLKFIGPVCNSLKANIVECGLEKLTEYVDYVPYKEMINHLLKSQLLLLVIDNVPNNSGFLSGKIFDYLGAKRPILGFGPTGGDAARIIEETNSGVMLDYEDFEGTRKWLAEFVNNRKNKINPYTFHNENYSRNILTKRLAKIFESMINE